MVYKKLPDICYIQYGYAFDSSKFSESEGVPLVRIRDVVRGYSETYTTERCGDEYIVQNGDMLIGMDGEFNIARWKGGKAYLNQRVCRLIPKEDVEALYLFYFMPTALKAIEEKTPFVTVKHLSARELNKVVVPVPSVEEQKRIAEKMKKVDDLIAFRQEQLAKLDELVKSRFIELFGDCKNEVLIGDVISISRGASPRPISAFITDREDGVNWIKIGDVSENSLYIMKTEERITHEGAKKSRMVHKGDFILSNSMSFGRPYILGINGCVHDGWLIMSDFKETFNELYLYHAIRSDDVQYQFSGKVNGATVKNLNSDLVKKTFIKVPPMELQKQFAAFVEQTDKSKLAMHKSLGKLETLKKALMQKYFG